MYCISIYHSGQRRNVYFEAFRDIKFESNIICPVIYAANYHHFKILSVESSGTMKMDHMPIFDYWWNKMLKQEPMIADQLIPFMPFRADVVEDTKHLIRLWSQTGTDYSATITRTIDSLLGEATNPFLTAIKWAQFLHRSAEYFPDIQNEITEISIACEKKAIEIINGIQSNRLKLLLLEHDKALDLIIKHELKEITLADSMQVLRHCLWISDPTEILYDPFIDTIHTPSSELMTWFKIFCGDYIYPWLTWGEFKDFYCSLSSQHRYFYSPIGSIQLEFFSYCLYLCYMVYIAILVPNVYQQPMIVEEKIFWIFNWSFVASESVQFIKSRSEYMSEKLNGIDIICCLIYILIFILRIRVNNGYNVCNINECVNNVFNVVYINLWVVLLFTSCLRIVYLASIFESMALLLSNIYNMMMDMANIFVFILIFCVGFATALYMSVAGEIDNYSDPFTSFRTTIYGFIDGLDWSEFNDIDGDFRSFLLQLWIFIFILFAVLILLNLIIAIMSSTYEEVNSKAKRNVAYEQWNVCYFQSDKLTILPPPFEFFTYLVAWIIRIPFKLCKKELILSDLICKKNVNYWCHKHKKCHQSNKYVARWVDNPEYYGNCADFMDQSNSKKIRINTDSDDDKLWINTDFDDDKLWICAYCAFTNDGDRSEYGPIEQIPDDNEWIKFRDNDKEIINGLDIVCCSNCYRVKHKASLSNVMESVVSFYCFVLVSIPFRIVAALIQFVVFIVIVILLLIWISI
eukprot:439667_1